MDFDKVFNILKDKGSREEFLVRLKQVGETSQEFQSLSQIMLSLGMDRTPRHVYETTILQNTFTFCEPFECFTKLRLVCKSWKFAIETKPRFDHIDSKTVEFINNCPFSFWPPKLYVSHKKIIQSLKNIEIKDKDVNPATFPMIIKSTRRLTSFTMQSNPVLNTETYESSVLELLRNSYESLRELRIPIFIFPQNLTFSNLTEVTLNFCDEYETLSLYKFQLRFQNLLAFAPNIKIVEINLTHVDKDSESEIEILDFVGTSYGKHCVICTEWLGRGNDFEFGERLPNHIPLKIMTANFQLDELAAKRYANQIQYLQLDIDLVETPGIATHAWHNYKIHLQSFTSLKGLCINDYDYGCVLGEKKFYEKELMEKLGESDLEFWITRINYMKSIGIKILDEKEFDSMKENISKTIPWRFKFTFDL